jgi:hypothetical protein
LKDIKAIRIPKTLDLLVSNSCVVGPNSIHPETGLQYSIENDIEISYLEEKELEVLLSTIRNLEGEMSNKKDKKFNKNDEVEYDWYD